mgnify:CR=1 FL=1
MTFGYTAIFRKYPETVRIEDFKAYDKDDNEITLDETALGEMQATIDAELAAIKYQDDRKNEYPDWTKQLDYIYHNGLDKWKTDIVDPVKAKYPKPS